MTYSLTDVKIEYSWDDSSWSTAIDNTDPLIVPSDGQNYTGTSIFTSSSNTGTLYMRATATDSGSNQVTASKSVTISTQPSSGGPNWLQSVNGTYNYGASWMYDTIASQEKIWWTSGTYGLGDQIWYQPIYSGSPEVAIPYNSYDYNSDGTVVSDPTYSISDVCVIRGTFSVSGSSYSYAAFFAEGPPAGETGSGDPPNSGLGDIGEAFSNDGVTWTQPIEQIFTSYSGNMSPGYGVGYPSVTHVDDGGYNTFCMFYWDSDQNNNITCRFKTSSDGIDWTGSPTSVSLSGISGTTGDGKCAYYDGYWYMEYADQSQDPSDNTIYVYKIAADSTTLAPTGSWSYVTELTPVSESLASVGGDVSAGGEGFRRDERGYLYGAGGLGTIAVQWNCSNDLGGSPDDLDDWSWAGQIWYAVMN